MLIYLDERNSDSDTSRSGIVVPATYKRPKMICCLSCLSVVCPYSFRAVSHHGGRMSDRFQGRYVEDTMASWRAKSGLNGETQTYVKRSLLPFRRCLLSGRCPCAIAHWACIYSLERSRRVHQNARCAPSSCTSGMIKGQTWQAVDLEHAPQPRPVHGILKSIHLLCHNLYKSIHYYGICPSG